MPSWSRSFLGPQRGVSPSPVDPGRVRLSQQYGEVIHSGGNNLVRLSQQYGEVIHSGGNNKVRLSQQYVEVIHGTVMVTATPRSWGVIIGV